MEKQDPARTSGRRMDQLKVGDYVKYICDDYYKEVNNFNKLGKIIHIYNGSFLMLENINYWAAERLFIQVTPQEYIVAKLKGRLYE